MLWQMIAFPSFLVWITFVISTWHFWLAVYWWAFGWISFWLSWGMPFWTWVYKCFIEILLSVPLSTHVEVGFQDNIVQLFILKKASFVFLSSSLGLYSHVCSTHVSSFPSSSYVSHSLTVTLMLCMKCDLTVSLMFLLRVNVEHYFVCLFAICITSEKCLFKDFCLFLSGWLVTFLLWWVLNCRSSFYILYVSFIEKHSIHGWQIFSFVP